MRALIVTADDVGLHPTQAEDSLELGDSFEIDARRNADHFARLSGLPGQDVAQGRLAKLRDGG